MDAQGQQTKTDAQGQQTKMDAQGQQTNRVQMLKHPPTPELSSLDIHEL
jgi:hypothetical protein